MVQKTSPFLGVKYGWEFGESGWNFGMDENLLKFSFLFDSNIDGIVSELPPPVNGVAYFSTVDKMVYYTVDGSYTALSLPKWFVLTLKSTGESFQFDGTDIQPIPSVRELDTRLDGVEEELSTLGTAAFAEVSDFATPANLDLVEANSQSYTDSKFTDLASPMGALLVGDAVVSVSSINELLQITPLPTDGAQVSVTSYHANLLSPRGGDVFVWDASRTKSDHDGGTVFDPLVVFPTDWSDQVQLQAWFDGSASTDTGCWVRRLTDVPDVSCFGAKGDGIADDTIPMQVTHNSVGALIFPAGTFVYTNIALTPYTGFRIRGYDKDSTVLKCVKTGGYAIDIDCLALTEGTQWFYGISASGITLEGNSSIDAILRLRKLAQGDFRDIVLREARNDTGVGLLCESVQLSHFTNIYCSQLYSYTNDVNASPPAIGLSMRLTSGHGSSSNNIFTHCYWEGRYNETPKPISMKIGIQLLQATQNVFIGGSPEHVAEYGLYESATCNYNTFIGVGFESSDSILDILAGGHYTRFINCYSSWKASLQGRGSIVEGGFFERLEVTADGFKTKVFDVTVNQWASGAGGFFDSGVNTKWRNIYDADLADYIYPNKPRTVLTMGASPYSYTNDTGEYRQIVLNGGTVTSIVASRNGSDFNVPAGSVSATLLAPGDSIVVTYTSAPTRFWSIPMNGMND